MILGVTGGTGFVGGRLIERARSAGHNVRALTRRPQPALDGVEWIDGALDRPDALARLVAGADAVIHVAGVTTAPDAAGFAAGNVDGTRAMVAAAADAGIARFVHVSSLAAREPGLSLYGASKQAAEAIVAASALDWVMVRPAIIYGPGELLDLFRMAARGFVLLPPRGRASIIGVDDLADLLIACAAPGAPAHVTYEPDDERPGGWTHRELAQAMGRAVGRRVWPIATPRALMHAASLADRAWRGRNALLTADRIGYLCHPDWTIDPAKRPPPDLWQPRTPTEAGLAATAAWYRANGRI